MVTGKLRLWTSGPWERAGVISALYGPGTLASQMYSGGLTVNGEIMARRRLFDHLSGLTARYPYVHNNASIIFICPDGGMLNEYRLGFRDFFSAKGYKGINDVADLGRRDGGLFGGAVRSGGLYEFGTPVRPRAVGQGAAPRPLARAGDAGK